MRKLGLKQSVGINNIVKKNVRAPTVKLGLTTADGQALTTDMLCQPNVVGVCLAPPCGTASLAREIDKDKPNMPQPLRNSRYPDGFPWLRGKDALRVRAANKLYQFTTEICRQCQSSGVLFTVENPGKAWFWSTSCWRSLEKRLPYMTYSRLRHCMFGSERKEKTHATGTQFRRSTRTQCLVRCQPSSQAMGKEQVWVGNSRGDKLFSGPLQGLEPVFPRLSLSPWCSEGGPLRRGVG